MTISIERVPVGGPDTLTGYPADLPVSPEGPYVVDDPNRQSAVFLNPHVGDEAPSPVTVSASPERAISAEPRVRAATPDDVDALVRVELSAYQEVYGNPTPQKQAELRQKYAERVDLLGDWLRVLEEPGKGVYGMMVCCRTNLGRQDFVEQASTLDMTNNDVIRQTHDPDGTNVYIVNLAILANNRGQGARFHLLGDAIQKGMAEGIAHTYFESRMPGFERWLARQLPGLSKEDIAALPTEAVDNYAQTYWTATRGEPGEERPLDPLLYMYTSFGCKPLMLVSDAWKTDRPSRGYGVLFEYTTPGVEEQADEAPDSVEHAAGSQGGIATSVGSISVGSEIQDQTAANAEPSPEDTEPDEASLQPDESQEAPTDQEQQARLLGFFSRAVQWARAHKTALALSSAGAGIAYTVGTGAGGELMQNIQENSSWIIPAYTTSMTAFVGGAVAMAAAVGGRVRQFLRPQATLEQVRPGQETLLKTGFWLNTAGALGAASVAAAGVVETLPPAAWGVLAIPAIDIYTTAVTRNWLYSKIKHFKQKAQALTHL